MQRSMNCKYGGQGEGGCDGGGSGDNGGGVDDDGMVDVKCKTLMIEL